MLDYILVSNGIEAEDSGPVREPIVASDHRPVVATVTIPALRRARPWGRQPRQSMTGWRASGEDTAEVFRQRVQALGIGDDELEAILPRGVVVITQEEGVFKALSIFGRFLCM